MIVDIKKSLEEFLEDRPHIRPTQKQKDKWISDVEVEIGITLNDNDIFFDNMPSGVKEDD